MKTFNFFFGLHLSKRLFAQTDNLPKTLQSTSLSAAAVQHLAGLTVEKLQSIRNEESFDAFYVVLLVKVKEYPACNHYRKIYFEAVYNLISPIKERFNQPAFIGYVSSKFSCLKELKGKIIP